MRENVARQLAQHGAVRNVLIVEADRGARITSSEMGWKVVINNEVLSSARLEERVFSSLDTACDLLRSLGVSSITVIFGGQNA